MKKLIVLLVTLILALPAAALSETVIASFFPIYLFADMLLHDTEGVQLYTLADSQIGCLHDYALTSGDLRKLNAADVFLINGAGMEAFLPMVTDAFPDLPVIDASQGIDLLPSLSGETEFNAHIWLDPMQAMQMCRTLADGLIQYCPEQKTQILHNLALAENQFTQLDKTLNDGLAQLARRDIVTFHEAFPYFARRYGLTVDAVIALEPDEALSAGALATLIEEIVAWNLPPLFTEPQYPSLTAQVVHDETGAPVYMLDPCVTPPDGELSEDYYFEIMTQNLHVLQTALGAES